MLFLCHHESDDDEDTQQLRHSTSLRESGHVVSVSGYIALRAGNRHATCRAVTYQGHLRDAAVIEWHALLRRYGTPPVIDVIYVYDPPDC
jgi:hypothetical protein